MIEVAGLTKRYGGRCAVDSIDIEVGPGEVFGFIGHNGAGKSTTIKMLAGLVRPTAGSARIGGRDCVREPLAARGYLGYVPESVQPYPDMNGKAFMHYSASFYAMERPPVDEWLERMGLGEAGDRPIRTYSKGMRQKLALAAALVTGPQVLILDEPLSGLDPEGVKQLRDIILDLRGEKTIFFSSHNLVEVQTVCDRVGFIKRGRMLGTGTVDQFLGRRGTRLHLELAQRCGGVAESLRVLPDVISVEGEGPVLRLRLAEEADRARIARGVMQAGGQLLEMRRELPTLEEVFSDLVGDDHAA